MTTTVTLDRYVLDSLMADLAGHDRTPAAYLVFLAIWGAGDGGRVALSYADLASRSGLSRRTVQTAVAHLHRRELLQIE
ncbi:MAG: helix-turn-helix domain-containing protein, partial [Chloroflexi bacterium]|nr:helix-turn-helix domain-containing protein [Chloroflexota bacterium]